MIFSSEFGSFKTSGFQVSSFQDISSMSRIFDEQIDLKVNDTDTFRVYLSKHEKMKPRLIFLLHGAGSSSYTWAQIVPGLKKEAYVVAFDARGHGHSCHSNETDLSEKVLIQDACNVLERVVGTYIRRDIEAETKIALALVGHSLGGSIATKVMEKLVRGVNKMEPKCLVLIDICEGTAVKSLEHTKAFLQRRPSYFHSVQDAVTWSMKGTLRNSRSAMISIPDTLVRETMGDETVRFRWRTNLLSSYKYWKGWYHGLSELFVSIPSKNMSRLLILADVNRLDKELTIAQMQGKFEMKVIGHSGHFIHEDVPSAVQSVLCDFFKRRLFSM